MSEVKPLRFTRLAKFDGSFVDIAVAPHINGGKGVELQLSKMLGDTPAYYYLQEWAGFSVEQKDEIKASCERVLSRRGRAVMGATRSGDPLESAYLQATPEAREALLVRLEAQRRRESKAAVPAVPAPAAAVKAGK